MPLNESLLPVVQRRPHLPSTTLPVLFCGLILSRRCSAGSTGQALQASLLLAGILAGPSLRAYFWSLCMSTGQAWVLGGIRFFTNREMGMQKLRECSKLVLSLY